MILVRIVWVMSYNYVVRWKIRRYGANAEAADDDADRRRRRAGRLVRHAGHRDAGSGARTARWRPNAFPHRDLIVFSAFCVVLVTLVVQGMTLGPLLRWLGLRDDGSVTRELAVAREETAKAALAVLEKQEPRAAAELLRREYQARLRPENHEPASLADLQQRAVHAQRQKLVDLRARDVIGDDAFHAAEEEIDLLELTADSRIRPDMSGP